MMLNYNFLTEWLHTTVQHVEHEDINSIRYSYMYTQTTRECCKRYYVYCIVPVASKKMNAD